MLEPAPAPPPPAPPVPSKGGGLRGRGLLLVLAVMNNPFGPLAAIGSGQLDRVLPVTMGAPPPRWRVKFGRSTRRIPVGDVIAVACTDFDHPSNVFFRVIANEMPEPVSILDLVGDDKYPVRSDHLFPAGDRGNKLYFGNTWKMNRLYELEIVDSPLIGA